MQTEINMRKVERKQLTEVGLPGNHNVLDLAYHQMSRTLFARVEKLKGPAPSGKLYFRSVADDRYQPVGEFPEGVTAESFVLDPLRPSLYIVTYTWHVHKYTFEYTWKEDVKPAGVGGRWDGLYQFDLERHVCERLARPGTLMPTDGYQEAWLSKLLAVSADGRTLICLAALKTPPLENGARMVERWITELELATMKLKAITQLTAVFA
jgi:hypothetical protein